MDHSANDNQPAMKPDGGDSQPTAGDNQQQAKVISNTVRELKTPFGSQVFVLGSAHFSLLSVQEVKTLISNVNPDIVMLELCNERAFVLSMDEETLLQQNRSLSFSTVRRTIADRGLVQGLIYIMFIKMSANLTEKLGVAPGGELRAAAQNAPPGCQILLIDRPISITVARAVASASPWQKIKLVAHVLSSDVGATHEDVEKCKDKDMLEKLLIELGGEFPGLKRTILDERNIHLAHVIYRYTQERELNFYRPVRVVAVVGIAHLAGVVENWTRTTDEDMRSVNEMPKKGNKTQIVSRVIKCCSIALLLYVGCRMVIPTRFQISLHDKVSSLRR